jgi:hypothetical protein
MYVRGQAVYTFMASQSDRYLSMSFHKHATFASSAFTKVYVVFSLRLELLVGLDRCAQGRQLL